MQPHCTCTHIFPWSSVWTSLAICNSWQGENIAWEGKVQGTNEMVIWERQSARCFFWEEDLGHKMKLIDDKAINSHVDAGSTVHWEKSKIYVENLEPVGNWMVTALMQWTITVWWSYKSWRDNYHVDDDHGDNDEEMRWWLWWQWWWWWSQWWWWDWDQSTWEMAGNMVLPSNFESNCDEWNDATNLPAILILNEDHPDDHPVMMMVQTMIDK